MVGIHLLEREQRVELPIERAFAFYGDARNLERITPPWLGFEVTTPGDGGWGRGGAGAGGRLNQAVSLIAIAKVAVKLSPAGSIRRPSPLTSALVGAVIGSKATASRSGGA